jgi:DNA-binding response OmpR family regulator
VELDPSVQSVRVNGRTLENLDPRLFDLLYVLVEHAPGYVTSGRIMSSMRLYTKDSEVAVLIERLGARLRRDLGSALIDASPEKGYRVDLAPLGSPDASAGPA